LILGFTADGGVLPIILGLAAALPKLGRSQQVDNKGNTESK